MWIRTRTTSVCFLALATLATGCRANASGEAAASPAAAPIIAVTTATALERPVTRFIRVTGTLMAQEQAEVAAEIAGRVVATPVESGTRVEEGGDLVRIAATEVNAQAQEAEANAAQIEARLGMAGGRPLDIERVPEVANARAAYDQAQMDFDRTRTLVEKKLVSQSEFDQRRTQTEAVRRQYDITRSGIEQQYQALLAARARVALAQKAVADTVVRAPFTGVVGQRLVSVGDYVTRGTKVASVMRTNPLRVGLTVPEQYIAEVAAGRAVTLEVDAYPGRTFTGQVRYVSPALSADSRALAVEAVVPNDAGLLKPGFFAAALIEQSSQTKGILVPAAAVRMVAGTARLYVVSGDHVEERIVTTGQAVGDLIEITTGLRADESVATSHVAQLSDGVRVAATR